MGRPSSFSEEIADTICERLIDGQSLRAICTDGDMPNASTVTRWLASNEAFRAQYTHAREAQADTLADEILDISDDGTNDWMERRREDGSVDEVLNHEHVTRSKLRVDARKWLAAKLQPKKYGDSALLKHADADGNKLDLAAAIHAGNARLDGSE
jgi:hypothetical protein